MSYARIMAADAHETSSPAQLSWQLNLSAQPTPQDHLTWSPTEGTLLSSTKSLDNLPELSSGQDASFTDAAAADTLESLSLGSGSHTAATPFREEVQAHEEDNTDNSSQIPFQVTGVETVAQQAVVAQGDHAAQNDLVASASCNTPFSCMSRSQLENRAHELAKECKSNKGKCKRLEAKVFQWSEANDILHLEVQLLQDQLKLLHEP